MTRDLLQRVTQSRRKAREAQLRIVLSAARVWEGRALVYRSRREIAGLARPDQEAPTFSGETVSFAIATSRTAFARSNACRAFSK